MSSVRAFECQPIRVDQAEPVPWTKHDVGPGLRSATAEWSLLAKQGAADPLRFEAGEHLA